MTVHFFPGVNGASWGAIPTQGHARGWGDVQLSTAVREAEHGDSESEYEADNCTWIPISGHEASELISWLMYSAGRAFTGKPPAAASATSAHSRKRAQFRRRCQAEAIGTTTQFFVSRPHKFTHIRNNRRSQTAQPSHNLPQTRRYKHKLHRICALRHPAHNPGTCWTVQFYHVLQFEMAALILQRFFKDYQCYTTRYIRDQFDAGKQARFHMPYWLVGWYARVEGENVFFVCAAIPLV